MKYLQKLNNNIKLPYEISNKLDTSMNIVLKNPLHIDIDCLLEGQLYITLIQNFKNYL